ncbi:transcription factor che-1-like [Dendronephthya gigantea]|uniref:transcription factor che-1-like n=1 Tax=Dendronephthya gigantea TaxID=151771 RepID=UPI00106AF06C|nr:transcription factor che-1-like [Dendronephthya gigantea]
MQDYSELPCPFPKIDLETSYAKALTHLRENFASEEASPLKQQAPSIVDFINDHDNPVSSSEISDPGFLLNLQEAVTSYTMTSELGFPEEYKPFHNNPLVDNNQIVWQSQPSYSSRQPFCNHPSDPTTHRLRHLPITCFNPYEQDYCSFPFSPQRLSYFDFPYSNEEESKMVLPCNYFDPNFALPPIPDYFNGSQIQDAFIPMQGLPHFYPQNLMQQSYFNPYQMETHSASQTCNDYHLTNERSTNFLNEFHQENFHHLLHDCPDTRNIDSEDGLPSTTNKIPGNQGYLENSMNVDISGTQPSSHQAVSLNVKRRKRTSCMYEGDLKASAPKAFGEPETGTVVKKTNQTNAQEARLSEEPKRQAVDNGKVTSKRGSRSCPVCDRQLARTSTLKIHLRQHSGDKPFKCDLCPKSFAQTSSLKSHHRTHSGERPYTCPRCYKTFVHSSALKTHVRTHTGERPHRCPVPTCTMAFADSSSLSKHARVHSGKRPYICDVCGRRFTQSGNMHKHRRSVHKETNESMVKMCL